MKCEIVRKALCENLPQCGDSGIQLDKIVKNVNVFYLLFS